MNKQMKSSAFGTWLRKKKLDELPQLFNVLIGNMSFVGPRPDVRGFLDTLEGADKVLLDLKPGITGPASLKYMNEEIFLQQVKNPEKFNREVIWPEKVRVNKNYLHNYSFRSDLRYLYKTIFP